MERNAGKNGLVNLVAAAAMFVAALGVTFYVNTLAGQAASVFLGLAVLVTFTSWFQMRLEENERLEKLELDELTKSKGGSALFEAKDSEVFPSARAREQFEKFFVPGFGVLLFLLEAVGAWLLWRWISRTPPSWCPTGPCRHCRCSPFMRCCYFLFGRFSVTMPGWKTTGCAAGLQIFCCSAPTSASSPPLGSPGSRRIPRADFYVARGLCVLLGLMAAEI